MLGDDHVGQPVRLVFGIAVVVLAVEEGDEVGVLLDGSRLSQVGEHRLRRVALLGGAGELGDRQHRHLELAGEDLQPAAHLADLLDPVGARVVGAHQLQVVDDDQAEAAPVLVLGVQPPRLRPQVEQAEVGGVVEPERRLLELVAGAHHLRPVLLRDLPLAQLVAGDPRPAGDEALRQLDLGHLEGEEGDRQPSLHRHVLGDVGDDRALAHRRPRGDDDQVAGLEAAGDRVDVAEAGGGAGQLELAGGELLQPVDLVVEDLREQAEVARLLFVGDVEEQLLGPLGELARFAVALVHPALDLLAGAEQPPQQRVLLDDLGVVLGVAGGRHLGGQLGDVVLAARLLDLRCAGPAPR